MVCVTGDASRLGSDLVMMMGGNSSINKSC